MGEFPSEIEPHHLKTCLPSFRPGPTPAGMYSRRRWIEALNFRKRGFVLSVKQNQRRRSAAPVTMQLICVFVFRNILQKVGFITTRLNYF